jgi:predicted dehydrogenase
MAQAYARVLSAKAINYNVIGRGEKSANTFSDAIRINPFIGGLKQFIKHHPDQLAASAIVALPVADLAEACSSLVKAGTKRVLVEKPGGLNLSEITQLADLTKKHGAKIYVALNRRFFSSVIEAKKRIVDDGGVTSFTFEFTEWARAIEKTEHPPIVKENWFLANSLHVVDLAFYLGGRPSSLYAESGGSLDWHSRASRFCGAGTSETGATFSYHADWNAPGSWGLEILTHHHRYILRPLEKLQVQNLNSIDIKIQPINDQLDTDFKPGLFQMVETFLSNDKNQYLPSISRHQKNTKDIYTVMLPEKIEHCTTARVMDSEEAGVNS